MIRRYERHLSAIPPRLFAALLAALGGLALSRVLFELLFPSWLWLGRPVPAFALALAAAGFAAAIPGSTDPEGSWRRAGVLMPLALNLTYLFDPEVNLVSSRLVLATSIWLAAVVAIATSRDNRSRAWQGFLLLLAGLVPIYLLTMPDTVGRADTFEFQVVAPKLGIAHPTGYPLYLLLGKLFTLLPFGSVAWRLNFGSTVFALGSVTLAYLIVIRLSGRASLAILSAIVLGLRPTFWSQAIEAEVYTLHALLSGLALWLMTRLLEEEEPERQRRLAITLALTIGLGLSNHLTSVFLIPPAALAFLLAKHDPSWRARLRPKLLLRIGLAAAIPLLLYLYLPIRWSAVNGEPMGWERFWEWVLGSRFSGALQWGAWLEDVARYQILSRLFVDNWGLPNLLICLAGISLLARRNARASIILLVTWLEFAFYALNYRVPDVSVFLLPAHLVMAISWGMGITAVVELAQWASNRFRASIKTSTPFHLSAPLVVTLAILPALLGSARDWSVIDRSQADELAEWGAGVLRMPLAEGATILADSEKIAPLLYLQQSERIRPDLNIMVLADEAAYRAELDARVAQGQTVYLARFLPGLEGVYHLRSAGPLTEVATAALASLPNPAEAAEIDFGPIQLVGYEVQPVAQVDGDSSGVTLYWQASEPANQPLLVHLRWKDIEDGSVSRNAIGQHPVDNYYPSNAWKGEEIVADFHLLSRPISSGPVLRQLQVALAPAFASPSDMTWRTITSVELPPLTELQSKSEVRSRIGSALVSGAQIPVSVRPNLDFSVALAGSGDPGPLQFTLRPAGETIGESHDLAADTAASANPPFVYATQMPAPPRNALYQVVAFSEGQAAFCGWLQSARQGCRVGQFEVVGVALPEGASNFDDRIALLSLELNGYALVSGGQLRVDLIWQALGTIDEDYTIFIQVLDIQDTIVGQVDSWPLQGTLPTSQWQAGEIIADSHLVQLQQELAPGNYRLLVGWYLLATSRRLPLLGSNGTPIDDKVSIPGLLVPASGE